MSNWTSMEREQREKMRQAVLKMLGDEELFVFDLYGENYLVSNMGRIKHSYSGKILKPTKNNNGYYLVKIYEPSGVKTIPVHRLVARTFLQRQDYEVNHINADKSDNRLINLELVTREENLQHARDNGLYSKKKGEEHFSFKFTKEQVDDMIEFQKLGFKLKEIAESFGTSISYTCTMIKQRQRGLR